LARALSPLVVDILVFYHPLRLGRSERRFPNPPL
jgi:hypothetical protein